MQTDRKEMIKNAYDKAAEKYTELFFHELQKKPVDRKLYDLFFEKVVNTGAVLEIGCGPGEISNYLKMKGLDITGIDQSEKMIELARKLTPEVDFQVGDVFRLNFKTNSVSGIVAPYLIVNFSIDDIDPAIKEMARVLAPSGLLMISFHTGNEVKTFDDFIVPGNHLEFTLFDPEAIKNILTSNGFRIEESVIRSPYEWEITTRAYLFARKI